MGWDKSLSERRKCLPEHVRTSDLPMGIRTMLLFGVWSVLVLLALVPAVSWRARFLASTSQCVGAHARRLMQRVMGQFGELTRFQCRACELKGGSERPIGHLVDTWLAMTGLRAIFRRSLIEDQMK